MTNYIPHHRKKKDILEKRERELLKQIKDCGDERHLTKAAENVREAVIRVINANVAQLRPIEGEGEEQIKKAKMEIEIWLKKSVDEIIELYKRK